MGLDLNVLAGLVLTADLVPKPMSRLRIWTRMMLGLGLTVLMEEEGALEAQGVLLVTRPDNGVAVRLTRSDREDGELLAYVRTQLSELTVGEFLDRWGIDPGALEEQETAAS